MAWEESNFEDRLANLKQYWETAESLGWAVSEADKLWDELSLELEFSGQPLAELEHIGWFARQWIETRNPHYIDAALLSCRRAGIGVPTILMSLVEDVAAIRIAGSARAGTGKGIQTDVVLSEALRVTCGLHLTGLPLERAASKAAQLVSDWGLGKTYKASTLEREYSAKYRHGTPSMEQMMQEGFERAGEEVLQEWKRLVVELPEADDDLKGFRR